MAPIRRSPTELPRELLYNSEFRNGTPGPGSYSRQSRRSPGVRFSRSPRPSTIFFPSPERTPGCIYSPNWNPVDPSNRCGIFSRASRAVSGTAIKGGRDSFIGLRSSLSKRACSFAASRSAYKYVYYPGYDRERLGRTSRTLGSYTIPNMSGRSGRSFTRSPRCPSRSPRSDTIGPGEYNPSIPPRSVPAVPFGSPRRTPRLDFPYFDRQSKTFWQL
jgi:hypothetical protein